MNAELHVGESGTPAPMFESSDPEETRAFVSAIFCSHRFHVEDRDATAFETRISHRTAGRLSFNRFDYATDVAIEPGLLRDFYLVQFVLQGAEFLCYGGERHELRPGSISVIGPDLPVSKRSPAGTRKLLVKIDRSLLESVCMQHVARHLREPLRFRVVMPPDSGRAASLVRTIGFLHAQLGEQASVFTSPLMAANLEHTLTTSLLVAQPSNYFDELSSPAPCIAPGFVKRVEDYIDAHADQPITPAELARQAGVSVRSLFAGFRKYRNTTPMAHLRFVRLGRARVDLLCPAVGRCTVTEVSLRWGFGHLGRFTYDYRRRFGETPSMTLRRGLDAR